MNTVVGKIFPLLPLQVAFGAFALFCLGGCALCYFGQPETAGLSLEQIDAAFAKHRPARVRKFWAEVGRARDPKLMVTAAGASDAPQRTSGVEMAEPTGLRPAEGASPSFVMHDVDMSI